MKTAIAAPSLHERAARVMPGGTNSPARAWRAVAGRSCHVARGRGARLVDEDGREFLDCVCGWGALLHGHAPTFVIEAVRRASVDGLVLGLNTRAEVEYAEALLRLIPWAEQVRLTNSGTEAMMTAVRIARAATGRPIVVRFDGGYHGHFDAALVEAGGDRRGQADLRAGLTAGVAADVRVAPYNDLAAVESIVGAEGDSIAAILVEPVAANMGVVPPGPGFLAGLREACSRSGALLVFDEVVTGFRIAAGGAVERFGVVPDLAAYGKVIGGGLPAGAVAGPAALVSHLAPVGRVTHAGTFAGNPITTAAGRAVLDAIAADDGLYHRLESLGAALAAGINDAIDRHGYPCVLARVGSMWTVFFTDRPVTGRRAARQASVTEYGRFFHSLFARGIHLPPSPLEAAFLSTAHDEADVTATIGAVADALAETFDGSTALSAARRRPFEEPFQ